MISVSYVTVRETHFNTYLPISNSWILIFDFSDKKVACGNHKADSCAQCPMDIGESWCNGECAWCEGKCQLKGKTCGELTASKMGHSF